MKIPTTDKMETEEDFDFAAAMKQIAAGFHILVPVMSQEEIETYKVPKKRNSRKKYHFLSFDNSDDDEEQFFEMTCDTESVQYTVPSKRRRRRTKKEMREQEPDMRISEDISTKSVNDSVATDLNSLPSNTASVILHTSSIEGAAVIPNKRERNESELKVPPMKLKVFYPVVTANTNDSDGRKKAETSVPTFSRSKESSTKKFNVSKVFVKSNGANSTSPKSSEVTKKNDLVVDTPVPLQTDPNSNVGKIRVKTAMELGSTILFVDEEAPTYSAALARAKAANKRSNIAKSTYPADRSSTSPGRGNNDPKRIELIADLYRRFFTPQNEQKIKNVAEILQTIAENAKSHSTRLETINSSKSTDAEKLMHRYSSYQEFKRNKEANEKKLKEKFHLVVQVFDEQNFETLFQLFFLGILKILIISVSNVYKKGTIFKRLVNLLSSSLTGSEYKNDRVYETLRSKEFRFNCISLVQFIERYSKTDLFGMLFLSVSDREKMTQNRSTNATQLSELMREDLETHHSVKASSESIPETNVLVKSPTVENGPLRSTPVANAPPRSTPVTNAPPRNTTVTNALPRSTTVANVPPRSTPVVNVPPRNAPVAAVKPRSTPIATVPPQGSVTDSSRLLSNLLATSTYDSHKNDTAKSTYETASKETADQRKTFGSSKPIPNNVQIKINVNNYNGGTTNVNFSGNEHKVHQGTVGSNVSAYYPPSANNVSVVPKPPVNNNGYTNHHLPSMVPNVTVRNMHQNDRAYGCNNYTNNENLKPNTYQYTNSGFPRKDQGALGYSATQVNGGNYGTGSNPNNLRYLLMNQMPNQFDVNSNNSRTNMGQTIVENNPNAIYNLHMN